MENNSKLNCVWASSGLALHNSGRALLCCHSRTYLKDHQGQDIYWHSHDIEQAWNSPTKFEIQQALDQGQRHYNCQACWDEEAAGRPSRRIISNESFKHLQQSPPSALLMDLKLGNTCNLACRHCWPEVSSKWINDYYEISVKPTGVDRQDYLRRWDSIQMSYDRENSKLWDTLKQWMPSVEFIDIFGAEPMLLSRLFDVLEYCVDSGTSSKQKLQINSNGTIWNQHYIDVLTKFQHAQINLSIDGIYGHFDYIRYGETWSTVESNIKKFLDLQRQHPNVNVAVCVTICSLNVLYAGKILEYFHQQNMSTFINLVHIPEYLNVRCLPPEVKQQVLEVLKRPYDISRFNSERLEQLMRFMELPHDKAEQHWAEFCDKTTQIDNLRSQDFASTFPEMYELVRPYWLPQ